MSKLFLFFSAVLMTGHFSVSVSHCVTMSEVSEEKSMSEVSKVLKLYRISKDKVDRACKKRIKYQARYCADRFSSGSISSRTILVPASAKVSIIKTFFLVVFYFYLSNLFLLDEWIGEAFFFFLFLPLFVLLSSPFFLSLVLRKDDEGEKFCTRTKNWTDVRPLLVLSFDLFSSFTVWSSSIFIFWRAPLQTSWLWRSILEFYP